MVLDNKSITTGSGKLKNQQVIVIYETVKLSVSKPLSLEHEKREKQV